MKVATFFLASAVVQVALGAAIRMTGGFSPVSPDSSDYQQCIGAAAFLQNEHSDLAGNLVSCAHQVVNGKNYRITLQLATGENVCKVVYQALASPNTFQDSKQTC
ncbi:hypothetical protein BGZ83_010345 [Gryganskiella cystojenkinii]|nr:hypothetical protein BGZ83_010345 [Gryganskiella cystojenkinii]